MRPRLYDRDIEVLLSALEFYADHLEEEERIIQQTKPRPTLIEEWKAYLNKMVVHGKVNRRVMKLRVQFKRIQEGKQKGRIPVVIDPYRFKRIFSGFK